MDVVIGDSARKRSIPDADILNAFRNPVDVFDLDDGLTMFIGSDRAGNPLEVGSWLAPTTSP